MTDYVGWTIHMKIDNLVLDFPIVPAVAIWCEMCDPGTSDDPNNCAADYTIDATSVLGEGGYNASYCQFHIGTRRHYDQMQGNVWSPPKERNMVEFNIMAANIESRVWAPPLGRLIREYQPDAVVMPQAANARDWLAGGFPRYKLRQYQDRPEGEWAGIAILVRRGISIEHRRALVMDEEWVGPKADKHHEPRVYPILRLSKENALLRLLGLHFPTANADVAQDESKDAIVRYFKNHDSVAAVGDYNMSREEMLILKQRAEAKFRTVGKVDHGLFSQNVSHISATRLPTPDGFHGWGMYQFEVRA